MEGNTKIMKKQDVEKLGLNKKSHIIESDFLDYTIIDELAFSYLDNLKSVKIPSTIKSINNSAFYLCKNLKEIYLPYGLEELKKEVLCDCKQLEIVHIPETLKRIKEFAFANCAKLKKLVLPYKFDNMNEQALFNTNLEVIRIPENVDYSKFRLPSSMKEIELIIGCYNPKTKKIEN